ncbi:putative oocyst wall 6, related protein [Toxoplasma gondii RUB]|uniref:Putative oocyst wall 6, related protein n=1 Tax=Toxoplasma gondii RUB TaxID=935652 RepID=A0A086LXK3_TOXGO|nr:putative oocyst wall 6, related protein [Toxoplasma gondii RUB]
MRASPVRGLNSSAPGRASTPSQCGACASSAPTSCFLAPPSCLPFFFSCTFLPRIWCISIDLCLPTVEPSPKWNREPLCVVTFASCPSTVSRCPQVEVEPVSVVCADGSAPSASFAGAEEQPFMRCLREEFEPSVALCSEGFDLHAATSRCVTTVKEAPGWTCPTGYRLPEHELPAQSAKEVVAPHLGSRKGDSPSPVVVGPPLPRVQAGFCERLEYAEVQFVCPVGFGREKDKKAKEWVCVAQKAVPATHLCDSGFFLEGDACVMHLTMAPSLVDQDGRPFPCVTRGDGSNSCGHAADWQGSLGVERETAKKHGKR